MAETSPSKIKVERINQVAIVVKDIQKTIENYWNMLGIGPWVVFTFGPPIMHDQTCHGRPSPHRFKIACAQVGPCELELLEPLEGDTIYGDFMAEHGEGLHHIRYFVDTVDELDKHVQILGKLGFPSAMGGRFGGDGSYHYVDTVSGLKCILEMVKEPSVMPKPDYRWPKHESEISPAKVKVRVITQAGFGVKNIQETLKNYWNILGIGPWDTVDCLPPVLHDLTVKGKPGNFTMKAAFAMVGEVQIELIEPLSGENIYYDFLAEHGERLHHLQFLVDDIDETTRIMKSEGLLPLMSLGFNDGGAAYYDTSDALKCIWEAFQVPKTMPSTTRYP